MTSHIVSVASYNKSSYSSGSHFLDCSNHKFALFLSVLFYFPYLLSLQIYTAMVQLTNILLARSGGTPRAWKRLQSLRINAVSWKLSGSRHTRGPIIVVIFLIRYSNILEGVGIVLLLVNATR